MPPSAISGTPVSAGRGGAVEHGRELRHADAGDEPGRAGEARADPDLDGVGSRRREIPDAVARRDVAGDDLDIGPGALQLGHRLDRRVGVTVGDVEDERVDLGGDQRLGAVEVVAADPDRGRHAKAALAVARRARIAVGEREIAQRDEAGDPVVVVHERQLLDPVRGQEAPRLLELDPGRGGDEPLARRHQLVDALAVLAREHVAGREQAEQPLLGVDDDEAGDLEPARLGAGLRDRLPGLDHVRLRHDVGQVALHPPHLGRLLLDREEPVEDADAAELRHRDRHRRHRDRVHVGRDDRHLELDPRA